MSEENKTVELKEEELKKVSGGYTGHTIKEQTITVEAGYYRDSNYKIYYLGENITGLPDQTASLSQYQFFNGELQFFCVCQGITLKDIKENMTRYYP